MSALTTLPTAAGSIATTATAAPAAASPDTLVLAAMDWDRLGGTFTQAIYDTLTMVLATLVIGGLLGLVFGIGGAVVFFRFLNMIIEGLPSRLSEGLIPYAFLLPALTLLGLMLIYPTVQTIVYSFANADSTAWVGLENYGAVFGSGEFWQALLNNFLWILIVPLITVAFGLAVAVLADKLSATGERVSKSMVFLPMSISFVGASTIWGLIYAFRPRTPSRPVCSTRWWWPSAASPRPGSRSTPPG